VEALRDPSHDVLTSHDAGNCPSGSLIFTGLSEQNIQNNRIIGSKYSAFFDASND
jgi:hypothetical protein